jgi:hypothetical protein
MSLPTLEVSIVIRPTQNEIPIAELDQLFAGEVRKFEEWFLRGQRERGALEPQPLISAEHAILRSYMYYLHTRQAP